KRVRTLLTQEQAEVLQSILAQTPFPSTSVREAAARELGISPRKVQVWFQNVRQKHR
ncbi:homeobox protein EgHBX4, partial [Microstroma glucosiphilum]